MAEQLTLMAVHAHPDDESSSTGGVLAKYSAEGIRTVVVTCTNGEFGDAPGGARLERPPAGGGTINVLVRELCTLDDTISEDPRPVAQLPARGNRDGSPGAADLRAVAPPAQSFASGRRR